MPHNPRYPSNQVALSVSFRIRFQVDFKRCEKVRIGVEVGIEWNRYLMMFMNGIWMAQDGCQLCFGTGSLKLSRHLYRYQETNQAVSRCNFCMLVRSPCWKRYAAACCSHCSSHCAKFRSVISLVFRGFSQPEEHQGVKKKYASQLKMPKWSGCIVSFIQNPIPGGLQAMRKRANGVEVGIVE